MRNSITISSLCVLDDILDEEVVAQKILAEEFEVQVSPVFKYKG